MASHDLLFNNQLETLGYMKNLWSDLLKYTKKSELITVDGERKGSSSSRRNAGL